MVPNAVPPQDLNVGLSLEWGRPVIYAANEHYEVKDTEDLEFPFRQAVHTSPTANRARNYHFFFVVPFTPWRSN